MTLDRGLCDDLSGLLAYPEADYRARLGGCLGNAERRHSEAAADLLRFTQAIDGLETERLQEQYTATFDLNPVASLDVGWHLYGENYDRGAFMVRMRAALAEAGVQESVELPDHLTHLLALVGRLDQSAAATLVTESLMPAIDKIVAGLGPSNSPFLPLVQATRAVLERPGLVGDTA